MAISEYSNNDVLAKNGQQTMTKEKAIELAVDALKKARHPYAVRSSGSSMLFEFGINAKKHYDKYTQAIEIIQKLGKDPTHE